MPKLSIWVILLRSFHVHESLPLISGNLLPCCWQKALASDQFILFSDNTMKPAGTFSAVKAAAGKFTTKIKVKTRKRMKVRMAESLKRLTVRGSVQPVSFKYPFYHFIALTKQVCIWHSAGSFGGLFCFLKRGIYGQLDKSRA